MCTLYITIWDALQWMANLRNGVCGVTVMSLAAEECSPEIAHASALSMGAKTARAIRRKPSSATLSHVQVCAWDMLSGISIFFL